VAKTDADRALLSADRCDPRNAGFAVFDLGGAQAFSTDSLAALTRALIIYGARKDVHGLDLDVESRAPVAALPVANTVCLEPENLTHFDFMGVCQPDGLDTLNQEEPDDV